MRLLSLGTFSDYMIALSLLDISILRNMESQHPLASKAVENGALSYTITCPRM